MIALIYPLGLWLALRAGGFWLWSLVPFNIVVVPLLDHAVMALAPRWWLPPRAAQIVFARPAFWLYGLSQGAVLIVVLIHVGSHPLSPALFMGLVSSTGIMTGTAGITAAHELIHRRARGDRALGLGLLAMVSYMQFRIEHVHGHHRHVATGRDPASAALGENFPDFFLRSLRRGWASAWTIEASRQLRRQLPVLSLHNRMVQYAAIQALLYVLILLALGWVAMLFFALQSLMAVHLLEAVNYVQHYGLRRQAGGLSAAEPVSAAHSWDAVGPISCLLSFNIGIHAQHHLDMNAACANLRESAQAPRLPFSFFLMVFVALIPPLWHRLMDGRAIALRRSHPVYPAALEPPNLLHTS